MSIQNAMGKRDGDFLELHNAWAKVQITRQDDGAGWHYVVTGDTESGQREFSNVAGALAYAWRSLALFQSGRFD